MELMLKPVDSFSEGKEALGLRKLGPKFYVAEPFTGRRGAADRSLLLP
jgi:hypothetical protein